jgi:hypothetical protein
MISPPLTGRAAGLCPRPPAFREPRVELLQAPGVALLEVTVDLLVVRPVAITDARNGQAHPILVHPIELDDGPECRQQLRMGEAGRRLDGLDGDHAERLVREKPVLDIRGVAGPRIEPVCGLPDAAQPEVDVGERHGPRLQFLAGGQGLPDLLERGGDDERLPQDAAAVR